MSQANAVSNEENPSYVDAVGEVSDGSVAKRRRLGAECSLDYTEITSQSYPPLGEDGEPLAPMEEDLRDIVFRMSQAVHQLQDSVMNQNTSLTFLHKENQTREEQVMELQKTVRIIQMNISRYDLPGAPPTPYSMHSFPAPILPPIDFFPNCSANQTPLNSLTAPPLSTESPSPIVDVVSSSPSQTTPSPSAQVATPVSVALSPSQSQGSGQTSPSPRSRGRPPGGKFKKQRGRKSASPVSTASTPSSSQGSEQARSTPNSQDQTGKKAQKKKKSAVDKLTDWIWNDKPSPNPRRKLNYKK